MSNPKIQAKFLNFASKKILLEFLDYSFKFYLAKSNFEWIFELCHSN